MTKDAPVEPTSKKNSSELETITDKETQVLWDLYSPKEEEGLSRFDDALTHMKEFDDRVVKSEELDKITNLIDATNRKLEMKFKREHKYDLEHYEERLYKEVVYDTRPELG